MPEARGGTETPMTARRLAWRRFRRHRAGMVAVGVLALLYVSAIFAELIAPCDAFRDDVAFRYVPPQAIHLRARDGWHLPFVYGLQQTRDPATGATHWSEDASVRFPVTLFHRGDRVRLAGLVPMRVHLLGADGPFHLLGTDRRGRDLLSRILVGGRVSLTVGLVGIAIAVVLGSLLGAASGWYGGAVDVAMQRFIELLSCFPAIPLWMALAAAVPPAWSPLAVYFAITVILSLLGWGGLARQVRGKVLAAREADYVLAARAAGAGGFYLVRRHLLPSAYGHIVVSAAIAIPGMILGETALSFLGLGIRAPYVSWGALLDEAEHVTVVLHHPWLLLPAIPVLVAMIAWNVAGDALRDAVDPYGS